MLTLLDYGKPNPFGEIIGKPDRLAWPVDVWRVTLPKSSNDDDGVNAFERVILKLLNVAGAMDVDALADETCIPTDLVTGILLRLRDKGFIDNYNVVIKQEFEKEEKSPVFITALLFRELATGKILPFLHMIDDTNPLRKLTEEKFVKKIQVNTEHKQRVPESRDVINTLRAMKKRSVEFGKEGRLPAIQQITIVQESEFHYLDCLIAIQKSDGEFRIADPFGTGFSLVLECAFTQLLEQDTKLAEWLHEWKQVLRNPRSSNRDDRPKEPYDNDVNRQRYPKLIANLRPPKNIPFRPQHQIHASIEWALFYTCYRRPYTNSIEKLMFTDQDKHLELLENTAKSIGLTSFPPGFRPIREGKLRAFSQEGEAELDTVLAIAILQAEHDNYHPLRYVASKHPNLIYDLFEIKRKRNEKGHGKGGVDAPETELPDDKFMREVVHALVPDICFLDVSSVKLDIDARGDALLEARASIQNEFTFEIFNRMGVSLQDRLIYAERFWLSCKDGDNALAFVCDLYAGLQATFRYTFIGMLPPDIADSEFITTAEEKVRQTGLGDLPECLRTVKLLAIRQTLQGNDPTLGACVLAFLIMSDDESLRMIADRQTSFIADIALVLGKRGHGNEPLPLSKEAVARLRKASYSTVKTLMEV